MTTTTWNSDKQKLYAFVAQTVRDNYSDNGLSKQPHRIRQTAPLTDGFKLQLMGVCFKKIEVPSCPPKWQEYLLRSSTIGEFVDRYSVFLVHLNQYYNEVPKN